MGDAVRRARRSRNPRRARAPTRRQSKTLSPSQLIKLRLVNAFEIEWGKNMSVPSHMLAEDFMVKITSAIAPHDRETETRVNKAIGWYLDTMPRGTTPDKAEAAILSSLRKPQHALEGVSPSHNDQPSRPAPSPSSLIIDQ